MVGASVRYLAVASGLPSSPKVSILASPRNSLTLASIDVARQHMADLLARLLKGRRLFGPAIHDQDHMPAKLGLDRGFGVLPGLQRKSGGGECRDHVVAAEIAEVAARSRRRVGRIFLGEGGEIGALVELVDDRLRLGLGLDEDVAGVNLLARRLFLDVLLIAGLELSRRFPYSSAAARYRPAGSAGPEGA